MKGFTFFFYLAVAVVNVQGLLHHVSITEDESKTITIIEKFRFMAGGFVNISDFHVKVNKKKSALRVNEANNIVQIASAEVVQKNISLPIRAGNEASKNDSYKIGYVLKRIVPDSQSDSYEAIDSCLDLDIGDIVIKMNNANNWKHFHFYSKFDESSAGIYRLEFFNCAPNQFPEVSFDIDVSFKNPNTYLSANEDLLPQMYFYFAIVFVGMAVVWAIILKKAAKEGSVMRLHYFLLSVVCLKSISLLLKSYEYYNLALFGIDKSWCALFRIAVFLKDINYIFVIMSLAGWPKGMLMDPGAVLAFGSVIIGLFGAKSTWQTFWYIVANFNLLYIFAERLHLNLHDFDDVNNPNYHLVVHTLYFILYLVPNVLGLVFPHLLCFVTTVECVELFYYLALGYMCYRTLYCYALLKEDEDANVTVG